MQVAPTHQKQHYKNTDKQHAARQSWLQVALLDQHRTETEKRCVGTTPPARVWIVVAQDCTQLGWLGHVAIQ